MFGSGYRSNGNFAVTLFDPDQAIKRARRLIPSGAPPYMTPEYVISCIQDDRIQSHWHTSPISDGDWYFTDWEGIEAILCVTGSYWQGVDLKAESRGEYLGNPFIHEKEKKLRQAFGCDYFIPDPTTYSKLLTDQKKQIPKKKSPTT